MALVVYLFIGVIIAAIYMLLLCTTFPALTDLLLSGVIEVAVFAKTDKHSCSLHEFRVARVQGDDSPVSC